MMPKLQLVPAKKDAGWVLAPDLAIWGGRVIAFRSGLTIGLFGFAYTASKAALRWTWGEEGGKSPIVAFWSWIWCQAC